MASGRKVANVTDATPGSTVPRRQLGRYLKELREGAGITAQGAADALEWSRPRIWRMETGKVAMRPTDVGVLCQLYGASGEVTEALKGLARETKSKGWWHSYGQDAVPSWFELYVGFEQAAARLRKYQADLVPGLLQTRGYMYEVIRLDHPEMSEEDKQRRVALRLERQALISRVLPPAPRLDVILSEAVLLRPVPDHQAMAAQLHHLAGVTRRRNVSVRIIPLRAGPHAGSVNGSFTVLDFPPGGRDPEPSTVYSESLSGALYLEKPAEVDTYVRAWDSLSGLALSEDDSQRLLARIAEEYESND